MPHAGPTVEPVTYAMYDGECAGYGEGAAELGAERTGGLVVSFPHVKVSSSGQLSLRLCRSCAAKLGAALLAEAL